MEMGEISLFSMLGGALDTLLFLKIGGLKRIREGYRTTLAYRLGGRHPARTYARVREGQGEPPIFCDRFNHGSAHLRQWVDKSRATTKTYPTESNFDRRHRTIESALVRG